MFKFPANPIPVFRDPDIQQKFNLNGYVVLPFYDQHEITHLLEEFKRIQPKVKEGFYPSTFSNDKNYRKMADQLIQQMGKRTMEEVLINYTTVAGSFIVKYPGIDSYMDVHQDMTLVDESRFNGINIWCPLTDLTTTNGPLYVLEKSHRLIPTYRGASIRPIYDRDIIKRVVKNLSVPLYLKAGEAVFFDQSILHFSPPNMSSSERCVTNIFFTQSDAKFQIAYHDATHDSEVEIFSEEISFMIDFEQFGNNITDKPRIGTSMGYRKYSFPRLTWELLKNHYPERLKDIRVIDKIKLKLSN